jgi:hypothetical protein
MDIQPDKSYLFHDRFLSALWLCVVGFTNSQRNPRQRIGAGHSILTNICDFSTVTSFEVSASKVRQLAANEPLVPDGNLRIIVAPQDLIFGYARMYEISGSNTRDHVHVVRTLAEAYRLLDVESLELSA